MSWTFSAARVLQEALDLVGVVLGLTGLGSSVGVTVAVLRQLDLGEIEKLGFQGTAAGFLIGVLAVVGVLVVS